MSTTTSQMCASTQSYIASTTTADAQLHQLPLIHLSSVGNNISGQAAINITFNTRPRFEKLWKKLLECFFRTVFSFQFHFFLTFVLNFPERVCPCIFTVYLTPNFFLAKKILHALVIIYSKRLF